MIYFYSMMGEKKNVFKENPEGVDLISFQTKGIFKLESF